MSLDVFHLLFFSLVVKKIICGRLKRVLSSFQFVIAISSVESVTMADNEKSDLIVLKQGSKGKEFIFNGFALEKITIEATMVRNFMEIEIRWSFNRDTIFYCMMMFLESLKNWQIQLLVLSENY